MNRLVKVQALSLLLLVFISAKNIFACSCEDTTEKTTKESYIASDMVFLGEVTKIKNEKYNYLVTFKVVDVLKGSKIKKIVIHDKPASACGYQGFLPHKKYLVFAFKSSGGKGPIYTTPHFCSGYKAAIENPQAKDLVILNKS